jgi:hypothetical protein
METSVEIIQELKEEVGYGQPMDFMHLRKGVPVVFKGSIQHIEDESVIFQVEPPDSVCLSWDEYTLILHDLFMSGLQARVLDFDIAEGKVELGDFIFADRGFGDRSMVRVEPKDEIEITMSCREKIATGIVADISLDGFGILAGDSDDCHLRKGDQITLQVSLLGQQIELPARVLGVYVTTGNTRLAVAFSPDAPRFGIINRYINRRRVEIRGEIKAAYEEAYQKAVEEDA